MLKSTHPSDNTNSEIEKKIDSSKTVFALSDQEGPMQTASSLSLYGRHELEKVQPRLTVNCHVPAP